MKVLITGGTGLVGSKLTQLLVQKEYEVVWLSRTAGIKNGIRAFRWDYKNGYIDPQAFEGVTHIVHLAGAGVFDKSWSDSYKNEITDSRIKATEVLTKISSTYTSIKVCVCASAIGVYGNSYNTITLDEEAPLGNDFLAEVTKKWEIATDKFRNNNVRTVQVRIGIVLAKEGGALPSMILPIKFLVGSPLGSGEQIISWIHIDDLCRILIKSIEDDTMEGVYNAVAPNPVSNDALTLVAAKIMNKPLLLPNVPSFALKIILGKEKSASVLQGIAVSANKITSAGFNFNYPSIQLALTNLLTP